MNTFIEKQMIEILVLWDMTLNPENYPKCKGLFPEDFKDAAESQAKELGIGPEFVAFRTAFQTQQDV